MGEEKGSAAGVGRRLASAAAVLAAVFVLAGIALPDIARAATYRVQPGDTLSEIASVHRITVGAIARLNRLDPNGILLAGRLLQLPEPRRALVHYRVRAGDTLSEVAGRYGTSVAAIARLNHLDPAAVLPIDRVLLLPAPRSSHPAVQASILRWAARYGVRPKLALGLAWQESGYQPGLTSEAGAWGVLQVMPATWAYAETVLIGNRVPRTIDGGIQVGMAYLHHLLRTFRQERRALAAYLQGERSVRENGILPSSKQYVANVLALAA